MNETGAFVPLQNFFKYFVENLENSVDNLLDFDFQNHTTMGFSTYQLSNFYLCFYLILPSLNTIYNKYLTPYVICVANNSNG
jgi:hypothetical protein